MTTFLKTLTIAGGLAMMASGATAWTLVSENPVPFENGPKQAPFKAQYVAEPGDGLSTQFLEFVKASGATAKGVPCTWATCGGLLGKMNPELAEPGHVIHPGDKLWFPIHVTDVSASTTTETTSADLGAMEPVFEALVSDLTPKVENAATTAAKEAVAELKAELTVEEKVDPPFYYAEASAFALDLGVPESWVSHEIYKVVATALLAVIAVRSTLLIVAGIIVVMNRLRIRRNTCRMDALEKGRTEDKVKIDQVFSDFTEDLIGEEGMVTLQGEALIDQQAQIDELREEVATTRGIAEGAGNLARTAIDVAEDVRAQLPDHVEFDFDQQLTNGKLGHLLDELAGGELITWMSGDGRKAMLVLKAADVPGKVLIVNGVDGQTQPVNIKNLLSTLKRAWKQDRVMQVALLEKAS